MKTSRLLPLLAMLIAGCVTPDQNLGAWINRSQSELMQAWGAPVRTTDDGQGGRILVYARQAFIPRMQGGGTFADSANNQMPQQMERTYQFFINPSGRIYLIR